MVKSRLYKPFILKYMKFSGILLVFILSIACNNSPKSPVKLTKDSLATEIVKNKGSKTLEEFRSELLKENPRISKLQLSFQTDTFLIERDLDNALGVARKDDLLGSARHQASLSYMHISDSLSVLITKAMGKDSMVFVNEKIAWKKYYFQCLETIQKIDDDKYLGLGSDFSSVMGQDVLQLAKQRTITVFNRFKRVSGLAD